MCRSVVPCAYGHSVVLECPAHEEHQEKNPKKLQKEQVLLLKAQNHYYFLIQKLSVVL